MKRRSFLSLAGAALALPAWPARAAVAGELRGVWLVRTGLTSRQAIDAAVEHAAAAGLNAVFAQVRGRGDAFYASDLAPRSPLLEAAPARFDPLAHLIDAAAARGLQVHAWINALLAANYPGALPAGHVLERHPEWAMVPKAVAQQALGAHGRERLRLVRAARGGNEAEGLFLTPAAAGVHEHLEAVVRELLARYALAGLHLDFIRYPDAHYDWSPEMLESFRRSRGERDLFAGPAASPGAFAEHRRGLLTRLVERLAGTARASVPGLPVSAAVVADEAMARNHKFQDWPAWARSGALDAVCPMAYAPETRIFEGQVRHAVARTGGRVWAGVGAWRIPVESTIEKIEAARASGAHGVVLFSHESIGGAEARALRAASFGARTAGGGAAGHAAR